MNSKLKKLSTTLLIAAQLVCSSALCSIPGRDRPVNLSLIGFDFSKGINFAAILPMNSLATINNDDIAKVIPKDMKSSNDSSKVAAQILDKSLTSFFNSDAVRHSEIGATAHNVENKIQKDVVIGGSEPGTIKHVFKFRIKAIQSEAQIAYTGIVNAQYSYKVIQRKSDLEFNRDLTSRTKLVFNHIDQPDERTDMVSVRWAW